MSHTSARIAASLAFAVLASTAATSMAFAQPMGGARAMPAGMERCYGVARAGHNDCASGAHSCAGQATRDNDPTSFVTLPSGACAKLAHGSTTPGH